MKICIEAMVDPCRIEMDGQNLAAPKKTHYSCSRDVALNRSKCNYNER